MAQRRLIAKLDERLVEGDYYEAHQIYRTIYYRFKREGKVAEAYNLLYGGAIKLLEKEQHNSGADLANLALDLLNTLHSLEELNHSEKDLVSNIRSLFQHILPNSPERAHFVSKALSIKFLPTTLIRKQFAEVLWTEKSFAESRLHFLYSSDSGDNCALMLVEYQTTAGFSSEVDLMIAQFVLKVLCIENKQLANHAFFVYTLNHPQIKCSRPPYMMPLLNFIFFLLCAIDKHSGKSNVFDVLCNLYEKSLNRDPSYKDYLTQIGQIYFGHEKKSKSGGLFSNLFQSMFEMKNEDQRNNDTVANITPIDANKSQDVDLD